MVLEYKFEYISNNNSYITFLDNIVKNSGLNYKLYKENDLILLYIEASEEKLLKISDELSNKLPMSLFLKNFTLEVVPQIPEKASIVVENFEKLPYCSTCINIIEKEYLSNSYISYSTCDICGATCDVSSLRVFENEKEFEYENIKSLLKELALKIEEDKKVRVKTEYYDYVFYKMQKLDFDNQKVLCTNLESLSKLVVSSEEKKIILSSIEKPSIIFNINEIYKKNHNIEFEKVQISLAKDVLMYLLSKELNALGIEFLIYEKDIAYDYEVSYDFIKEKKAEFLISVHNNNTFILQNSFYNKSLNQIYNKFNQKAKAQFMVLLKENEAYDKTILNLFCSTTEEEQITLYSQQIDGMIDILKYKETFTIDEIFNNISESQTGKRLLENYKNRFPNDFKNCIEQKDEVYKSNCINSLWKIVSLILGFENSILENARKALLQKGPRVDYKLMQSEKVYNRELNITKLVQSGISFKLAGVDEKSLSLGYVESYSYFLADIIDEVNKEFPLDGVSLCGDIIADEFFYKTLIKAVTKNFKLFYNKDFPIQL